MAVKEGLPYPRGATWDGKGVNFALFSAHASKVELCLFDDKGQKEKARIALPEFRDETWHGYVPDIGPGTVYAYRVHGPYAPEEGHRFNPHKLLLDPYARAHIGGLTWHPAVFGYKLGDEKADLSFDTADSAPYAPLGLVSATTFDWGADAPPRRPWHETVIYELHVKGFTALNPAVPPELRPDMTTREVVLSTVSESRSWNRRSGVSTHCRSLM